MGKYLKSRKRRATIAISLTFCLLLSICSFSIGAVVHAEKGHYYSIEYEKGDPYFVDIDTKHPCYLQTKACNERHAFGDIKGVNYRLYPEEKIKKGEAVLFVYNLYHKKIDWGDEDYSSNASKSWQWAQSNGLLKRRDKPKQFMTCDWNHEMLNNLALIIDGRTLYWPYFGGNEKIDKSCVLDELYTFFFHFKYDPKKL